MIAQPSPNLSLTSLHFFLCSLFLFAFPSVFFPLLKGFLFLTAIFIFFFFCCLYLFSFTKCILLLSLSPTQCCIFCSPSSLGAPCRAWILRGADVGATRVMLGSRELTVHTSNHFKYAPVQPEHEKALA